ncbi:MAG: hypothetical protein V3U72_01655 [Candidatus Aenigmarchaeota archaeon]
MINRKLSYATGITVLIIGVAVVSMCTTQTPEIKTAGGAFYIKPAEYTLPPGGMVAVLLMVENNDPDGRSLYYSFNFEAVRSDIGKPLEEISKWVLFEKDSVLLAPNETGFKDSVVSIPSDSPEGECVFNAYACYGETAEELSECGKNSQNLWADPLKLTIRVAG